MAVCGARLVTAFARQMSGWRLLGAIEAYDHYCSRNAATTSSPEANTRDGNRRARSTNGAGASLRSSAATRLVVVAGKTSPVRYRAGTDGAAPRLTGVLGRQRVDRRARSEERGIISPGSIRRGRHHAPVPGPGSYTYTMDNAVRCRTGDSRTGYQFVYPPSRRRQCGASQYSIAWSFAAASSKVTPRPGAVGSGKFAPSNIGIVGKRSAG